MTQVSQIVYVEDPLRYDRCVLSPLDYSLLVEIWDGFIAVSAVCVRIIYQVVVSRARRVRASAVSKACHSWDTGLMGHWIWVHVSVDVSIAVIASVAAFASAAASVAESASASASASAVAVVTAAAVL